MSLGRIPLELTFSPNCHELVWTSVAESGVTLTVRYLCKPRKRRGSADKMWEEILTAFASEDNIELAYPTWRFYDNLKEGKSK